MIAPDQTIILGHHFFKSLFVCNDDDDDDDLKKVCLSLCNDNIYL